MYYFPVFFKNLHLCSGTEPVMPILCHQNSYSVDFLELFTISKTIIHYYY